MKKCKILSITKIGKQKTFNVTMKSKQHNYAICDKHGSKVFTKNSHAAAYGLLAWQTCYLKANYPDEFVCAFLNTEIMRANYDKVETMEKDAQKNLGIKILPRSVNDCDVEYKVVKKKDPLQNVLNTEIRPSVICKGIGLNAAKNIADNRPYKDVSDFARRTEGSIVDSNALGTLVDQGYFKGKKINRDEAVAKFIQIKQDIKKAARRGVPLDDMFEDL